MYIYIGGFHIHPNVMKKQGSLTKKFLSAGKLLEMSDDHEFQN